MVVERSHSPFLSEADLLHELNVIRAHKREPDWFFANETRIYTAIQYGLNFKGAAIPIATEALFAALNNYRWHQNYRMWIPLVTQAMDATDSARYPVTYARLFVRFGSYLLQQGEHWTAARALDIASAMLSDTHAPAAHLERLLLLLRMQGQRSHEEVTKHSRAWIEEAHAEDYDPELAAELYLDKCHLLLQEGDPHGAREAYGLARRAYRLWHKRGVFTYAYYSALLRIKSARIMFQLSRADRLIRWLKPKVNMDGTRIIYAHLLYEEGSVALCLDDLARAATCLSEAASIFDAIKMLHHAAGCQMALSLALIADQQYEAADQALADASNAWSRLHYAVGHVRVKVYAAYSAIKRRRWAEAQTLLQDARTLLTGIKNETLQQALLAEIQDMEGRIDHQAA